MKLLLHACCGPCLIEPLDELASTAEHLTIVYANSNIHPAEEYERRRDTLLAYAAELGADVVELPYDPAAWVAAIGSGPAEAPQRCRACYRLRFSEAAAYAAERGYDTLTTTLTISPYQDAEAIAEEGRAAAEAVGIDWLERDYRPAYPDATRRSRELGMYRQNYCGCVHSDSEARQQREERRRRRAAGGGTGGDASGDGAGAPAPQVGE